LAQEQLVRTDALIEASRLRRHAVEPVRERVSHERARAPRSREVGLTLER
jgi:hypothetical protein